MKVSVFTPTVTVNDDGHITIDFIHSFSHTYDAETGEITDDCEAHAALLDAVLAPAYGPQVSLDRLLEYWNLEKSGGRHEAKIRLALSEVRENRATAESHQNSVVS